jgi:hypothetical protein
MEINANVEMFIQKDPRLLTTSATQNADPGQLAMEYRVAVVDQWLHIP